MKRFYKALYIPLMYLTVYGSFSTPTSIKAEQHVMTPEQAAFSVFAPIFSDTNPNSVIDKSFYDMCLEAVPHLEKSAEKELRDLAGVLKKLCQKKANIIIIGTALCKYMEIIKKYVGTNIVDPSILKKRLNAALNIQ